MTITIDLKPETLAALQADAEAQGRDPAEQIEALYGTDAALEARWGNCHAAGKPITWEEARRILANQ